MPDFSGPGNVHGNCRPPEKGEQPALSGWVRHEEWVSRGGKDLARQLRHYRQKNCWEIRNGDIWINASVFSCDEQRAQARRPNAPPEATPRPVVDLQKSARDAVESIIRQCKVVRWDGTETWLSGREKGEQYVYLITCEGNVKVGVARWPERRMLVMQGGNPFPMQLWGLLLPVDESAFQLESRLHGALSVHLRHGEWFGSGAIEAFASMRIERTRPLASDVKHLQLVRPPGS